MSVERRRTRVVRDIVVELFESGKERLRPGDVNAMLRERNAPMGTWEVRAEFNRLEELGVLVLDAASADWLPGDLSAGDAALSSEQAAG